MINNCNKSIVNSILKSNKLDFDVIMCSDGVDILKLFLDDSLNYLIKCILTDENMEYLCGSEAVRILRLIEERKKTKKINIITITCHEDESILSHIKDSGSDYVLTKPINKNVISNIFKQLQIISK